MDKKTIIANASERLGIASLNPMQLAVLSTDARRLILLAPTGSGKTLAFTIALLKKIDRPCQKVQAVVLEPSRELALQTADVVRRVATGYKTSVFYGGHALSAEVDSIKGAVPDIVVATPGRLVDHLTRGSISIAEASILIIDEYDKSLELGFLDTMKKIGRRLPKRLNLAMLTSATPLAELPGFIDMEGAEEIDFTERTTSPRSRMSIVNVVSPERDKIETLSRLLLTLPAGSRTIVFVNHRESAERVYKALLKRGFPVGMYHGGLEQRDREEALELLNNATTPILVSTDLASRGLDIDAVESVVHYHHATSAEAWTHRNGRTARVDASGTVYCITAEGEDIPEFEVYDRELNPNPATQTPHPSGIATLFVNAGKKDKISKGDIAGFLIQQGGLDKSEVGRISVSDHRSLVAVPAMKVKATLENIAGKRLKNKSVKIEPLRKR